MKTIERQYLLMQILESWSLVEIFLVNIYLKDYKA